MLFAVKNPISFYSFIQCFLIIFSILLHTLIADMFFSHFCLMHCLLQGRDATPYLERNRVGRDAIDAASALTDMGKYLFLERRLPVYDIAVAITKLDMCR